MQAIDVINSYSVRKKRLELSLINWGHRGEFYGLHVTSLVLLISGRAALTVRRLGLSWKCLWRPLLSVCDVMWCRRYDGTHFH